MMSVEQQAKALADWLASNPGAEPPEGVDSDVIEAVYSLRPDLAPAPRVSMDDILGLVTAGPLAAPATPAASSAPVAPVDAVVSSIPEAISTPTPANNNRRLWAVLGGVAALAAAVLVTVQVSMTASQGSFAPENSVPALAQAPSVPQEPSMDGARSFNQPSGASRQLDTVVGGTVTEEQTVSRDGDGLWDAVADLGVPEEQEEEADFEFANDADMAGEFRDETGGDWREDSLAERQPNGDLGRNEQAGTEIVSGSAATGADRSTSGLLGGDFAEDDAAFGAAGAMDSNDLALAARPRPAPASAPSAAPARVTTIAATPDPAPAPPPPTVTAPEPEPVDVGWTDDLLDAAVADAEDAPADDQWEEAEARSADESVAGLEVDELVVVESTRTRRDRDSRRGQRRDAAEGGQAPPAQGPSAVDMPREAPVAAQQEPSPVEPSVVSRFSTVQPDADAGVIQAQQRARALANRQQYGNAFDTLSGYISPSAPIDVVLDSAEYAFAAGRWADTVRVASIRIDANVPSDSPQSRSRLYDYRARAQAMLEIGRAHV